MFGLGSRVGGALAILLALPLLAFAQHPTYTNHAGNVISGVVIALDSHTATLSNTTETVTLPLSIFPESEQRRLAADFGTPRVPLAVHRAVTAAEKRAASSFVRISMTKAKPQSPSS